MKEHCIIEAEDLGGGKLRLHFSIDIQTERAHSHPPELIHNAFSCLRHLMLFKPDGETPISKMVEAALNDNEDARLLLRMAGIRIMADWSSVEGFIVAASGPATVRVFGDSQWADGMHRHALATLPGSRSTGPMNFAEGKAFRGIFLPARLMYEAISQ